MKNTLVEIAGVLPIAPGRGADAGAVAGLAERARERRASWSSRTPWSEAGTGELLDSLPVGGETAARRNLSRLLSGEAVSVTSGQQPALLGGPLLTLYKAATAVAWARRLSERGVPAVPVFWVASDDADFEEASRGWWARGDLRLVAEEVDPAAHVPGRMVGCLPGGAAIAPLERAERDAAGDDALPRENVAWAAAWWRETARDAGDLGSLFGRALARIFQEDGLVVVDSRVPALREAGRALLSRYLDRQAEVRSALEERAAALTSGSEPPVLEPHARAWGLFRVDGEKRVRIEEEGRAAAAREFLAARPPALSPNVTVRPVLEDSLFPHVARVVGPSELRYHDEILPAYETLEVWRPVLLPRLAATLWPAAAGALARRAGCTPAELLGSFDETWRRALASGGSAHPAAPALAALRRRWQEGVETLRGTAAGDASLAQRVDRAARKVDYEIQRLEEALAEGTRRELLHEHPSWRNLKEYLKPRGKGQERLLSTVSLLHRLGEEAPRRVVSWATRHAERWEEGFWEHLIVDEGGHAS